jgi:hypothetical protein
VSVGHEQYSWSWSLVAVRSGSPSHCSRTFADSGRLQRSETGLHMWGRAAILSNCGKLWKNKMLLVLGITVFWDVTPCSLVECQCFGETCCLHLCDRRVSWRCMAPHPRRLNTVLKVKIKLSP